MIEVEYVPERTERVTQLAGSPEDVRGEVIESRELEDETGRTACEVTHEIVVNEETYRVYTEDAKGKESRQYWIRENEDGDWYVDELRKSPNRGHPTVAKSGQLSTPAVREAMEERGIDLVN
jgi:hypothetical protein